MPPKRAAVAAAVLSDQQLDKLETELKRKRLIQEESDLNPHLVSVIAEKRKRLEIATLETELKRQRLIQEETDFTREQQLKVRTTKMQDDDDKDPVIAEKRRRLENLTSVIAEKRKMLEIATLETELKVHTTKMQDDDKDPVIAEKRKRLEIATLETELKRQRLIQEETDLAREQLMKEHVIKIQNLTLQENGIKRKMQLDVLEKAKHDHELKQKVEEMLAAGHITEQKAHEILIGPRRLLRYGITKILELIWEDAAKNISVLRSLPQNYAQLFYQEYSFANKNQNMKWYDSDLVAIWNFAEKLRMDNLQKMRCRHGLRGFFNALLKLEQPRKAPTLEQCCHRVGMMY